MSGNLLNNDNKTNYLFKKENFKSQTKLDGFSSGVTTRTFAQELYEGKSITLNSSIFGVDISKNIPFQVSVRGLYDTSQNALSPPNSLIPDVDESEWPPTASSALDQNLKFYDLSNLFPSLDYYRFYKRVYLEPVELNNPSFWWLPERPFPELPSPDNNLLANMIPAGISFFSDTFTPIVEFYNSSIGLWQSQLGAFYSTNPSQNSVNWSIDYATGILTLNVSQQHLNSISFSLDAGATTQTETTRPRISFMKYIGPLGAIGSGSGSGSGISDVSFNDLVEDISQNTNDISVLDISLNKWLFAIPDPVTRAGPGGLGYSISTANPPVVTLEWINPPQRCAAFDFYNINTEIFPGNSNLDQIYYATNNGLNDASQDHQIWNTITRSMNKLPFHERIVIQVKTFDSNQTMIQDWTNMDDPTISNSTNTTNNNTRYPVFKDVNKAVIISNPSLATETTQQIGGDNTYRSTNVLNSQNLYRFRIALDNRSCDGMSSPHTWTPEATRDINGILNWTVIPEDPNVFIELGNYGPPDAPTSIEFIPAPFNHENYPSESEIGTIEMTHTGVMDLSFNTAFNTSANILGQFGFDLSGSLLNTSVQLGSLNTVNPIPASFDYCNRIPFTFQDVSYNTGFTNSNNHLVKVSNNVTNPGTWNTSGFVNTNGLEAYPQHVYDISGFYFMNDQFPDATPPYLKAFASASAVINGNKQTEFSTNKNTAIKVFGSTGVNFMDKWSGNVDYSNNNVGTPNYQIHLANPPPNYPSGTALSNDPTKLAKVRINDNNGTERYAILIDSGSILDISFNIASDYGTGSLTQPYGPVSNFGDSSVINFITCPHGQGNVPNTNDVGEKVYDTKFFKYELEFDGWQGGSLQSNTVTSGNLYGWQGLTQSTTVPYPATFEFSTQPLNLTIVSDDATGPVVINPTILQEKYGGYYNIHKIRQNTGIYNLTTTGSNSTYQIDDISHNNYNSYNLVLSQEANNTLLGTKTLKFNLGHVSTFDILPDSTNTHVDVSTMTTQRLFGVAMPTASIPIEINFKIDNIYKWWTWPTPEKLMVFEIFYRFNKAATGLDDTIMIDEAPISNRSIDWTFPITGDQTELYQPTIDVSTTSSPLRSTYKYSRKGKEGTTSDPNDEAQFFLRVTCKNNIYRPVIAYLEQYFSNNLITTSSPSATEAWDWGAGVKHILWWDYTYYGVSFTSNGTLPENFINNSNSTGYKLKDSRGSSSDPFGANWLGRNFSASSTPSSDHEWYFNDYDHSHKWPNGLTNNAFSLEDNQLIWSNGSFKSGFASGGTVTNNDNPYIDYRNYYDNTSLNLDYSAKGSSGESWNYTFTDYEGNQLSLNGDYKFIVIEDSTGDWFGTVPGSTTRFDGVEVYINGENILDSLTLGDDYIMYICGVGSYYGGTTPQTQNAKTFIDANGNTLYRSGWMDCQAQLQQNSYSDGVGCFPSSNIDSFNTIFRYGFNIQGLDITNSTNGTIDKIFYRIGLKNDSAQLSSSTYTNTTSNTGATKNIIESIKITYIKL